MTEIRAAEMSFQQLNEQIHTCQDAEITLTDVMGQRYIASGLSGKRLAIHGIPGNALGAYVDDCRVEVFGNAQDATGDTMNAGEIIIHGSSGDATGYAMRGGMILVEGNVGYRAGIHMKAYKDQVIRAHASSAHAFAAPAVIGAYDRSEDWLDQLLGYLEGNMDLFCTTVNQEIPKLRVRKPEGTYLAWGDCSGLGLEKETLRRFMVDECGLALNDGSSFGTEGDHFVRVNLACPRSTVEECLRRLRAHCC